MSIFNYKYTCSDIDNEIERFTDNIQIFLDEYTEEILKADAEDISSIKADTKENFYAENAEDFFEAVRKTNSDMRDSAEEQLSTLTEEKEEVEEHIEELEDSICSMDSREDSLLAEIEDLKDEINKMQIIIDNNING